MIEDTAQEAVVIWDDTPPDFEVSEKAVIVNNYVNSKSIGVSQEGREVNIPYRMIPEMIKVLVKMKKEGEKKNGE